MASQKLPREHETNNQTRRSIDDLPGPRGLPFLGNMLEIDPPRLHQQAEDWSRKYGDYYRFSIGPLKFLACADPQVIATILKDRPGGFRRTSRIEMVARELGIAGLFSVDGEDWHRQRPMVMSAFDPAHVKAYFPSLVSVTERFRSRWQGHARKGEAFDLQSDLMLYTVDVTAGLAFGADINTIESDDDVIQKHMEDVFRMLHKRVFAPFPYWHWIKLPEDRRLERNLAVVHRAVENFIAQARARLHENPALREHPSNLIEAMVAARDVSDSGLSDSDVSGNVLTMLLAGEDTTANTLSWMIYLLSRHPEVLHRVRAEVDSVLGSNRLPVRPEQVAGLDYVGACAEEAMRLRPVAPILLLQAKGDTAIADIAVPKGTTVCAIMRMGATDERHFPDATSFDPGRWLSTERAGAFASPKRISMPFGAGPRMCPGRYLALLEIKMAISMLIRNFEISSVDTPDANEVQERMTFTMAPVGLKMRLAQRD